MTIVEFLLARIADDEAWRVARYPGDHRLLTPSDQRAADRWLAESRAKRVAVEWYENDDAYVMAATVEAMAAIYADHPDYDEAWRA